MIEKKCLGLEEARVIVDAVLEASAKKDVPDPRPMAVAVVDDTGKLICAASMDGTLPISPRMAFNKAYSCVQFQRDGLDQFKRFITDEEYGKHSLGKARTDMSWFNDPRVVPLPGGVLIKLGDGSIVGAVGTSGRIAMVPMGDEELARIGAKAFTDKNP